MYLVQPFGGNNYYTDNLNDAMEVYNEVSKKYETQLLEGDPWDYKILLHTTKTIY